MYPHTFFSLFPAFPQEDTIFVAMSFAAQFDARWIQVIEPAIRSVRRDQQPFKPLRVDARTVSDSILTEILSGIGRSRLVLADVTAIGKVNRKAKAVQNPNVMYEVGLAHAVRLPEEVLLFRSDRAPLLFDLANVRVNQYDPDGNPAAAKEQIASAIIDALREVDLARHLAVARAAERLDYMSFWVLAEAQDGKGISHPISRTMRQGVENPPRERAIERLLEMGAIRARYVRWTAERLDEIGGQPDGELLRYHTTEFGKAVYRRIGVDMNFHDLAARHRLDQDTPGPGQKG
jgi:hypothetical protein